MAKPQRTEGMGEATAIGDSGAKPGVSGVERMNEVPVLC